MARSSKHPESLLPGMEEMDDPAVTLAARVAGLYISRGHNYFGHHGRAAGEHPMEFCAEVQCEAGRGLVGDRFYDYKRDYKGQVTFFAMEVFRDLLRVTGTPSVLPSAVRRNVFTEGIDLNALIGQVFVLQGVRFLGTGECTPCYWMDTAVGPGAEAALKGRGGLRAKVLSTGVLRVDVSEGS